jgi:hypothetical protein
MHPEILRQLTSDHTREIQARARRAGLARLAGKTRRHGHTASQGRVGLVPGVLRRA